MLLRRILAFGHGAWGLGLLAAAAWFTVSAFRVLPYMSSGSLVTNLASATLFALQMGLPSGALGVWMLVVSRRLWVGHPTLRRTLLQTHVPLLAIGTAVVWIGVVGVRAAARSAAVGGGLLGGVAYIPLILGAPLMLLAACSLGVALAEPRR